MKKILLSVLIVCAVFVSIGQPWTKHLPDNNVKNELTLKDYQDAFNTYWAPYDLDRGYYIDKKGEKQKARGWKQFKRWEYYWETQVDTKTGQFPEQTAYQVYKEFVKNQPKSGDVDASNWTNLGTTSSNGGYNGIGRINCIAYHPTDNDTYWVGTPAGGLWVTTDNGANWEVLTDGNGVLGVSDIVIPSDYETSGTIYIATGDRDASDNRSIGVLKSIDNGTSWQETGLSFTVQQNAMTNRLLIDPNGNNVIIAATTKGVFKTTDSGTTWTDISAFDFIDMEYKPGDFSTLYGSTKNGSIYYSNDAGENWNRSLMVGKRIELAVTSANDAYVYAVVAGADNGLYGIYKSQDSGESFDRVFSGDTKNLLGWSSLGSDDGGQGWYDLAIAVSPINADIILVGGVNTWGSTDGGATFSIINHWWGDKVQAVHADKHMLSYRSNGDLFECNDGGVYISSNDGSSWIDKTNGIANSQMYKLGVSQQLSNEVITGLQDNGTKLYSENKWDDVKGGDGMECLIDYADYKTQYGTYVYGQITRTTDWWNNSKDIEPLGAGDGAWVTPYIIDPANHNTLYAGYADVWKSTNKGDSWNKISSIDDSDKIRAMAIAPSNNKVLYVSGTSDIYKTTDGGSSWKNISSGLPTNFITYIAVSITDPNTVWVTLGGFDSYTVYQSTDGGEVWDNISLGLPDIPANSIVQDANFPNINSLYVGTEAGVYHRIGNDQWELFNTGLPNVKVGELEIYYDADITKCRLRAATYGRGLWETPLLIPNVANVEFLSVESITQTNAIVKAKIIDGNDEIIESGFVYSSYSGVMLGDKYANKVSTGPLVINGEFSINIENLTNGTYYYIKAFARSEYAVAYSDEITFVTQCGGAIAELPVFQEYSVDSLPVCWDTYDNLSTSMEWVFNNPANIEFNSSTSSNGFASMNSEFYGVGKTQDADLVTTEYDLTNHDYVNLVFEHKAVLFDGAQADLLYSDDNGVNWNTLKEWTDTIGVDSDVSFYVNDISDIVGGKPGIMFKWNFRGANSGYWAIDDVLIDTLHAVQFTVTDKNDNPIKDALVTLGSTELTTSFGGEVLYRSVSNTTKFDYSVAAEGYVDSIGAVTLNHNNAILNIVLSKIPSAIKTLSDLMVDGVTIDGFSSSDIYYTVKLAWDDTEIPVVSAIATDENATLKITQPTVGSMLGLVKVTAEDGITEKTYKISFKYEPVPTFTVTFNVTDKVGPVAYTTVRFLERVRSTDEQGNAEFAEIEPVGDTIFTVTANSYNDYVGDVSVVDQDVNVDVVMSLVGLKIENSLLVNLYPNPTKDKLYVDLGNEDLPAIIQLTDVLGKLVFNKEITKVNGVIDLKEMPKGIYIVNVSSNDKMYTEKIVIE